jgi:hypothetical protein
MAALDLQLDTIRYWRSDAARRVEEVQYLLRSKWPAVESPPPAAKWDYEKHWTVDQLMQVYEDTLGTASTYWVASDIIDLVAHASLSLPDAALHPGDLPSPRGFVVLEHPILVHGVMNAAGEVRPEGEGPNLMTVLWGTCDLAGEPGLFVSWGDLAPPREPGASWNPSVLPSLHWGLRYGEVLTANMDRWMLTFFRLSCQRIALARSEPVGRHVRRRAERAKVTIPEDGVQVVTLRRERRSTAEEGDVSEVDWTHQWIVDGHWRDQWYPSLEAHRPIWIAPYVKGPEDKPLVVKDKVYRFVR